MMSASDEEELQMLRASAAKWMTDPLERACFELEGILEKQHVGPVVGLMGRILLLLKDEVRKC